MYELRLLTVCSMNICRSPAAAELLAAQLGGEGSPLEVRSESAGCADSLVVGAPRCDLSQALIGVTDPKGHAQPLTPDAIAAADVVITADRGHKGQVASLVPGARQKTFALLEADRLAAWVVGPEGVLEFGRIKASGGVLALEPGDIRSMVEPLPGNAPDRIRWLLTEMDAARGVAPLGVNPWEFVSADQLGCDDLPDPHVLGMGLHEPVARHMLAAARGLAISVQAALHG